MMKRDRNIRRQAKPLQPLRDRFVNIDNVVYRVTIQQRFQPTRRIRTELFDIRGATQILRWLLWSVPARAIRRCIDPDGWTVTALKVPESRWIPERKLRSERLQGVGNAIARADEIVGELEDGDFTFR
jgi:hypothetical protein